MPNLLFRNLFTKRHLLGDWLWPAIWMMPRYNAYGTWPASGEIDIMESRGNRGLFHNGVNIGSEQISHTMHFGPDYFHNGYLKAHYESQSPVGDGYDRDFHVYGIVWTESKGETRVKCGFCAQFLTFFFLSQPESSTR